MRRCDKDPKIPNIYREVIISGNLSKELIYEIEIFCGFNTPGYIQRSVDSGYITEDKGWELTKRYVLHMLKDFIYNADLIYEDEHRITLQKIISKILYKEKKDTSEN